MIGPLVTAVRELVVIPQAAVTDPEHRAWDDPDVVRLAATSASLEVVPESTTPIRPEIGAGIVNLRHILVVSVTVEDSERENAFARRNAIVIDLLRRAVTTEWENVTLAGPEVQRITHAETTVAYAVLESDTLAGYAEVTFTFDTEWRL